MAAYKLTGCAGVLVKGLFALVAATARVNIAARTTTLPRGTSGRHLEIQESTWALHIKQKSVNFDESSPVKGCYKLDSALLPQKLLARRRE